MAALLAPGTAAGGSAPAGGSPKLKTAGGGSDRDGAAPPMPSAAAPGTGDQQVGAANAVKNGDGVACGKCAGDGAGGGVTVVDAAKKLRPPSNHDDRLLLPLCTLLPMPALVAVDAVDNAGDGGAGDEPPTQGLLLTAAAAAPEAYQPLPP
jgi:hypothetical protein